MSLAYLSSAPDASRARNFFPRALPNPGTSREACLDGAAEKFMQKTIEDVEQMARLAAGDPSALHELYATHGRALLRFSTAMCRSRQAAEDLVHDTFVALLHGRTLFDPAQGTVFAYLCGVLRHRISRHFRQEKRWVALDPGESLGDPQEPGSVEEIARSELSAAFRRAMLELPLQHREVIALCDLEELPYATVAGILDCPVGTVRSRLHRARALLTLRLASLELIELEFDAPLAQEGVS
jgi:RNA polymerase sigma-70 factor (ECF subfamily)